MSGQEVNEDKTNIIFSNNVSTELRHKNTQISHFKVAYSLGRYLGIPLTGKALKRHDYQYILDNMSVKLASWKAKYLSFVDELRWQIV